MKIFISQPMNGRSDEDIIKEREKYAEQLKQKYEDVVIIDSFVRNVDPTAGALYYLGRSISLLAAADAICFAPEWYNSRGCRIEYTCAKEYGIKTIDFS